jgi:hypothetical protein
MPSAVTRNLLDILKSINEPTLVTETQLACGDFLLTVLPFIEADPVQCYRLEITGKDKHRCQNAFIAFAASGVFSIGILTRTAPRLYAAHKAGQGFADKIEDWQFRMCQEPYRLVMEAARVPGHEMQREEYHDDQAMV